MYSYLSISSVVQIMDALTIIVDRCYLLNFLCQLDRAVECAYYFLLLLTILIIAYTILLNSFSLLRNSKLNRTAREPTSMQAQADSLL